MGAQEGRDVAHPDIPTYGFVIQVPQEQEMGSPPQPFPQGLDTRWGKDREREEATQESTQAPLPGTQQDVRATVSPNLPCGPSACPHSRSSWGVAAARSEVDPQHILAGDRALAGWACHGQGALLLPQAGPAQEMATGQLVHRVRSEVGRTQAFAGGARRAQAAARLLW